MTTRFETRSKAPSPSTPSVTPAPFRLLQRHLTKGTETSTVPSPAQEVLRSPGMPLDPFTRNFMELRFGYDFSRVRVHKDGGAAQSTRQLNAAAYTVGDDMVFGAGQYAPQAKRGRQLLAHELAHVVQQSRGGRSHEAESRAEAVAERIAHDQWVRPEMVGGARLGLYKQNDDKKKEPEARQRSLTKRALSLNWEEFFLSEGLQLSLPPPISKKEPSVPELPSRLPVLSSGRFSLGLRLGFPELEAKKLPGAPESALKQSLRRAKIIDQFLTGKVPSGWEEVDKGKLAKAVWGIFSTKIAPDLARDVSSSLSTSVGPGGVSYELDLVILTDFSGGGLSFTIRY